MKKLGLVFIMTMLALQVKAQVVDLKNLANKTPDEIIALYGSPEQIDNGLSYTAQKTLVYPDFMIFYNEDASGGYTLNGFTFSSNRFCIFSDYLEGGIKIGDSLERLQSIDFVHTPYGRDNQKNALRSVNNFNYYKVYSDEYYFFYFKIENGVITEIQFTSKQDIPYPNYSNPNSPFGN